MIRCLRCGIRLADETPCCAVHGAPAAPPPPPRHDAPTAPQEWSDTVRMHAPEVFAELGYRIDAPLGQGGFGVVYSAERRSDRKPVAIKVAALAQPHAERCFSAEAAALRLVGPPHVPSVHASGTAHGFTYLVLELIRERTLADHLVAHAGPMPLESFLPAAEALLRAIEAIHARGVVHRDLKPENIFLEGTRATIIDFGLALDQRFASSRGTQGATDGIGTAEYMSPEQSEGALHTDLRSDIYSLGVVFYEMLSGAPPFWGPAEVVREAHRSQRPAPLPIKIASAAELDRTIRRCLAKDPNRRFDSVTLLRRALRAALDRRRQSTRPIGKREPHAEPLVAAAESAPREEVNVGLVFFESPASLGAVQSAIVSAGGQIVQTSGLQYVAAFGHEVGDNPARSALIAAQRLHGAKLSQRLLVDVAAVSARTRPDGSRRLFSSLFTRKDRFPSLVEPEGVMLAQSVSEVIPDVRTQSIPGRDDRFILDLSNASNDMTTYGAQQAPFVGRAQLIDDVLACAEQAAGGAEPTVVTVIGASGYGRTHLAGRIAQRIEQQVPLVDVICLAAQESIVGAVSQIVPELLRRLLCLPIGGSPADPRALLRERLGHGIGERVWAAAALALGWIDADHPDVRRVAAAPGALRLAAARAAGEALRKRAREKPVAILLDDAHLADDATLDALEYATLREAGARVFVCALVRPSFAGARVNWGSRAAHARTHVLGPLERAEAIELARRLLQPAEYIPPLALSRLAERTQGVPRLLVELVRGLKRDGVVRRSERGTGFYLATDELEKLPQLPIVQWTASREIDALPRQLAGHARLASVLGSSFTVGELEALLWILEKRQTTPEDLQLDAGVGIRRLIEAGLLVQHRSGLIDFRHALLRDTIYQAVAEGQRTKLHRAAFEMYQTHAMPDEQRMPRIALHAARCGAKQAAAAAYIAVAERALKAHAYLEAEAAFGSALQNLSESDARVVDAARGRGLMRFRLGRQQDALNDVRHARERAHALGATQREVELLLDEATVLDWTRDLTRSAQLVQEAEVIASGLPPLLAAKLRMSIARVYHRRGEAEVSAQLAAETARAAEELGDLGYETLVVALLMAAPDCASLGRLEEAERYFDRAIAEADSHADLHHLGAAHVNRAFLWFAYKDVQRLMADLTRATQIAREIGEPLLEHGALINMAEVAYAVEDLDHATEYTHRAIELTRQLWGDANRELNTRWLMLARIALHREDLSSARELLARIRPAATAKEAAASDPESEFFPSDQMLFAMVELSTGRASERTWLEFMERARAVQMQPHEELEILEARACAAFRDGQVEQSHAMFEAALLLSQTKPNLLGDRVARNFKKRFRARHA